MIVITTSNVALPPAFVAVTVYVAASLVAFGVPDITPVAVLKLRPAGNAGEIE